MLYNGILIVLKLLNNCFYNVIFFMLQATMRLFKRRCSDPSPQLVSLSPLCQDAIHEVPPPPPPPTSTPREAAERLAMSASRRSRTVADRRGLNTPGASSLGAAAPSPKSARKGES